MRRIVSCTLLLLSLTGLGFPAISAAEKVALETNRGVIILELDPDKAPQTVENFLAYVDAGFYDGTIFHRVIDDFMIQGGGYTEDLQRKATREPIRNEAHNGLKNVRGTVSMARTNVVDSATSQFFINLKDNAFLDHRGADPRGYGYAVFGRVVEGLDVVEKIGKMKTVKKNREFQDLPEEPVILRQARRVGS